MLTERRAGAERFKCARLHARDFRPSDTLKIASVLQGDEVHYLNTAVAIQCLTAQPGAEYVRLGVRQTLKIAAESARGASSDHIAIRYANSAAIVLTACSASVWSGTAVASSKP